MAEVSLLISLGVIMIASTAVALVARRFKQPILFAYIVAGVLIGPLLLNLVPDHADILVLSELGVAFLLFAIGLESDFARLLRLKYVVIVGGLLQVLVTTAVVFFATQLAGMPFIESLYLGVILSFSSTVVAMKYLSDRNEVSSLHGRLILGYAIVQDLLAVILLPLLANPSALFSAPLFADFALRIVVLFCAAGILGRFVIPPLLERNASSYEVFFLLIISTCLGFMALSHALGFSIAIGAFIGGIALSSLPYNSEALGRVKGLRDFFVTIFFVSLGMQLTLSFLSFPLHLLLLMFAVIYLLNPLIFYLITYFSGYGSRTALTVGLSLEQASEFSFIVAAQGIALGQLAPSTYSVAVLVVVLSMATTPYVLRANDPLYARMHALFRRLFPRYARPRFSRRVSELDNVPDGLSGHILVMGSGVFGSTLSGVLRAYGTVVVSDHDPHVVKSAQGRDLYTAYGRADNPEVWKKVGIESARVIVSTVPDAQATLALLEEAKRQNPRAPFFARAQNFEDALALYRAGADSVILPLVLGSNECVKQVLGFLQEGEMPSESLKDEYLSYLHQKTRHEARFG